ncbi:hypothetical protein MRX96_054409 [Rhipicephalus microplus]
MPRKEGAASRPGPPRIRLLRRAQPSARVFLGKPRRDCPLVGCCGSCNYACTIVSVGLAACDAPLSESSPPYGARNKTQGRGAGHALSVRTMPEADDDTPDSTLWSSFCAPVRGL